MQKELGTFTNIARLLQNTEWTRRQLSQECQNPLFCASWPWPFYLEVNVFPWLIMVHFCVKFGDPNCFSFWDIIQNRQNRQTDKHWWKTKPQRLPSVWGNKLYVNWYTAKWPQLLQPVYCCISVNTAKWRQTQWRIQVLVVFAQASWRFPSLYKNSSIMLSLTILSCLLSASYITVL